MKKTDRRRTGKTFLIAGIFAWVVCLTILGTPCEAQEKTLRAGATTGFFGAESLDVANGWDGWIMSIYGISENLLRLDEQYVARPYLAETYEQKDDLTWVFTIRSDVSFSNGTPVTAEAVKACLERTYEMNARAASTLPLDHLEAEGQQLTIVTTVPDPTIVNELCDPLFGIYDASREPDPELGVVCTGPYKAEAFTAMTSVEMSKNEYYWQGEPKLDHVSLMIVDDMNTLTMALQNGEIDMIARLDAMAADLFSGDDRFVVETATSSRAAFLRYNLETPGLDDPAVRRAIGYCIDRENFASVVYNGYAEPIYGVYSSAVPYGGSEGLTLPVDRFDPEEALAILTEAGYQDSNGDGTLDRDGTELAFSLLTYSYNPETLQLADMLQAELSQIGIGITVETLDVLDDRLAAGEFNITAESYAMAPIGTPGYFINMVFRSSGPENYGRYSSADVDELADRLSQSADQEEQTSIARQICQQVVNDRPCDFVAGTQLIFVTAKDVTGVKVNPSEYYMMTWDIGKNG